MADTEGSGDHLIPPWQFLHRIFRYGVPHYSVQETDMYRIVASYLRRTQGVNYAAVTIGTVSTAQFIKVPVTSAELHKQAFDVAQYLYDVGYYVTLHNQRIPCGKENNQETYLLVSWDPAVIRHRPRPSPCWTCGIPYEDKVRCVGCEVCSSLMQT